MDKHEQTFYEDQYERALLRIDELARQRLDALTHAAKMESALRRFLQWDALTALPDPLPAPFGDLHYWIAEFRRALDA